MKDEKEFKEKLRTQATILMEKLGPYIERVTELAETKGLSPEEQEELQKLWQVISKARPVIELLADFFGENAYKQSVANYYHMKELAAQGNTEAQKAVEELKPLFEEALKEQIRGSES